jgi:hypothetical protein
VRSRGLPVLTFSLLVLGGGAARAQTPRVEPPATASPAAADGPSALTRDGTGRTTVRAFRVEGGIDVDGRLDESHYTASRAFDGLVQAVPEAGGVPSERTEVWLGFDDANLYVGARVWDAQGESGWIANEMRRDSQQLRANDSFGIYFDTYYDRRNALGFFVNPIGGFADVQLTNEGSPNFDWNAVWDLRTGRFEGGWTVEMAIPFKSLRYRPGVEQTWGVQIRRSVLRDNEWSYLTPIPIQFAGGGPNGVFRVSLYADLVGIEAPPLGRNLEVKPFATSGLRTDKVVTPALDNDGSVEAGLDVKYAITQNLTADFTVNTDFAQVEVDEQQVNLTRFGLTFPEKRDFFLESRGTFNFATGGVGFGGPGPGGPGGGGGGDTPTMFYSRTMGLQRTPQGTVRVPILAGARLTGKVGAFDVGALTIQTREDEAVGADPTNFAVFRLRRDVLARSSVGVLFQNRSRSVVAGTGSNQAWGLDGTFGITTDLSFITYYARSHTPNATGKEDSYRAQVSYGADLVGGSVDYLAVGDAFNPEVGLVRRSGFEVVSGDARFSPRPAAIPWIRQLIFGVDGSYLTEQTTGFVESLGYGGSFQVDLDRGDSFSASASHRHENLTAPARISGALFGAGRYFWDDYQVSYRFGPQRPYQGNLSVRWGGFYTGTRRAVGVSQGRVEVTPQLSMEPSLEFNWIDLPQQTTSGQFNQHVARLRTTYTLTPRAYVSALVQYASGSNTVSGNFRLRWEWAPGSELFLVYTEDRNTDPLTDRWSELSTRGLVVKVTRLFRP